MLNKKFNQDGSALILVLLAITIIGILVPPLFSNIMSSVSQYQKTEEMFQRKKLEEMAKLYIEKKGDTNYDNFTPSYLQSESQRFKIHYNETNNSIIIFTTVNGVEVKGDIIEK